MKSSHFVNQHLLKKDLLIKDYLSGNLIRPTYNLDTVSLSTQKWPIFNRLHTNFSGGCCFKELYL